MDESNNNNIDTGRNQNKSTQRSHLTGMAYALELFGSQYGEMSVLQMRVFVAVARRGRCTGAELGKALNLTTPNISRCVAVLSDIVTTRRKSEPLGLVKLEHDLEDRRVKYVVLTDKGVAFAAQLVSQF